jgi:membrane dipeptidase
MLGSDEARSIHADHPPIDLHADTLMWSRWTGYDLHKAHEPPLPLAAFGGHVDLPRMREGGMSAQFFSMVSLPLADRVKGMARIIHEQIDNLESQVLKKPGTLRLVKKAGEVAASNAMGEIAALLGIEGAHALEGDLENVRIFARRGVRYIGLLHFTANEAGFPAYGKGRSDNGLTPWGCKLVEACEDSGVLVDLAHVNKQGFLDACSIARKPPIVSHTGVLGAFEHWRNIDDVQLRAVADKGGVVGVIFCPRYVGGEGLDPVIAHLKHIVNVVGEDAAALGSDWDGFIVPTKALKDPRGLPLLTDAMLAAGFSREAVGKILHDNVMRVLREA